MTEWSVYVKTAQAYLEHFGNIQLRAAGGLPPAHQEPDHVVTRTRMMPTGNTWNLPGQCLEYLGRSCEADGTIVALELAGLTEALGAVPQTERRNGLHAANPWLNPHMLFNAPFKQATSH
jgi:hypothetical protein